MKPLKNLGSVVLLKNGVHKLMVAGRYMRATADDQDYDYIGVLFPEGYIGQNLTFLFNDEDIQETFFPGYSDSDDESFLRGLSDD